MNRDVFRPVTAAAICTFFGLAGVLTSSGQPGDTPKPEDLTPNQAEEKCREVEAEVNAIEALREVNPVMEGTRESRENVSEERESESSERENEHSSGT